MVGASLRDRLIKFCGWPVSCTVMLTRAVVVGVRGLVIINGLLVLLFLCSWGLKGI